MFVWSVETGGVYKWGCRESKGCRVCGGCREYKGVVSVGSVRV